MRIATFNVCCTATYHSELQIPDSVPKGKELEYIREHLGECKVFDLEWLADLDPDDAVTQDDIKDIYETGYVLTESGHKRIENFIAECNAKRKELLDAKKDTADNTVIPTEEDILSDMECSVAMDSESGDYIGSWGVTDNSDLTLHLEYGVDFQEA